MSEQAYLMAELPMEDVEALLYVLLADWLVW